MKYTLEQITMSDNNINVFHSWIPEGQVKACVILSHGMREHVSRYQGLAKEFCDKGLAVFGEDHRGHGETAALAEKNGNGQLGYLADHDGFFRVVEDIHEEVQLIKERYPQKKVFIIGHSFGSFITQGYIEKYGNEVSGAIICGSAGPRPLTEAFAKIMGSLITAVKGRKKPSPLIEKLAFGSYNSRIKNPYSQVAWLTRNNQIIDQYLQDPWCTFECSTAFYKDMFTGLRAIHKKKAMKMIPQELPVYLIAGTADPVGSYSKTVSRLFKVYHKNGISDLSISLWEDCRHELYNELNGEEIIKDSLEWILDRL
ncbi:alpha/beta fold hydrolase [Treponema sp.]|uniref:alpha/beta fold hydrolase n=1 Tax=Treponema sp. TaxID=166 RepID=UPI0025CD511B|nr:alpha/beta hydrolase [Treponema sp.]MCR5217780.1 lysophospholipase [Treponema sp.]